MKAEAGERNRWILTAAIAVVVLGLVVMLFRSPRGTQTFVVKSPPPPAPAVKLLNLRKNEAALTDPTPLFLPTEWNAGQNALPANAWPEPGSSFGGYPPNLRFAETELALSFPPDVAMPARPVDVLVAGKPGQIFLGLETSHPLAQLYGRKAFVEITDARLGQRILAQPLADADPPGGTSWQPMEFLVAVDTMGLVGPPTLTESSHVAAVDGYFRKYLVKTLHAGERLAPGFYRICIGP